MRFIWHKLMGDGRQTTLCFNTLYLLRLVGVAEIISVPFPDHKPVISFECSPLLQLNSTVYFGTWSFSHIHFFISQIRSEENNKHTQNKESATSLFEPWNKTNFSMETSLPLTRLPRMPSKTLLTASAWAWLRKADPGTAQVFQNLVCLWSCCKLFLVTS